MTFFMLDFPFHDTTSLRRVTGAWKAGDEAYLRIKLLSLNIATILLLYYSL